MVTDFQFRGSLFPSLSLAGLDALFRGFLETCDEPLAVAAAKNACWLLTFHEVQWNSQNIKEIIESHPSVEPPESGPGIRRHRRRVPFQAVDCRGRRSGR